jgi:hypothetical protein
MQPQIDISTGRMLVADWFRRLAGEDNLHFDQYGSSEEGFRLSSPSGLTVKAQFVDGPPYLKFIASDPSIQTTVDVLAERSIALVARGNLGDTVWYSTSIEASAFQLAAPFSMGPFFQQLARQTRISGWRRLGGHVLLEFTEELPPDAGSGDRLLAPKSAINVHVAVVAPLSGYYSSRVSHSVLEVVTAICGFALGRGVQISPSIFPSKLDDVASLTKKQSDLSIGTLARRSVPLDVFSSIDAPGGIELFWRIRAALLTFDAAIQQPHDSVACVLYVVTAESICVPDAIWRKAKSTKRFKEFFLELIPSELDNIIEHANFESVFQIKRGKYSKDYLRRALLEQIYEFRSTRVHSGLEPSYGGITSGFGEVHATRRGLLANFAETAVLAYLCSPRSSLIGNPKIEAKKHTKIPNSFLRAPA